MKNALITRNFGHTNEIPQQSTACKLHRKLLQNLNENKFYFPKTDKNNRSVGNNCLLYFQRKTIFFDFLVWNCVKCLSSLQIARRKLS